jgi:hypothetical protein
MDKYPVLQMLAKTDKNRYRDFVPNIQRLVDEEFGTTKEMRYKVGKPMIATELLNQLKENK